MTVFEFMKNLEKVTSFHQHSEALPYAPRNRWKPHVVREAGAVRKDYGQRSIIVKLYGRVCLRWEKAALKKLEGIEGIPAFQGMPTPFSLKMEAVPGKPLERLIPGELSKTFLLNLTSLFHLMHQRGVAHGDVHQRNILADGDRPYLIDFSTAYIRGRLPLFDKYVFRRIVSLDLVGLYNVEKRFFGTGKPPKMFLLYRIAKALK